MSKRSQEKRRARAKEKAKLARRERGASPLSRLAGDGSNIECWMHYVAEDARMVNIVVFRPVRDGTFAAAFFLVDYDCIGLKDAFYRFDVMPTDIVTSFRERSRTDGSRLIKTTGDEVRKITAAAVRWTREHRFRVSKDWEKCSRIVGGTIDTDAADLTGFGTEDGGLLYVGRHRDLEKLLLDETLDDFMQRPNVKFQFVGEMSDFGEDEEEFGDEEEEGKWSEEEFAHTLQKMREFIFKDAVKWCEDRGKTPHPQLKDAVELRTITAMTTLAKGELDKTQDAAAAELFDRMEEGDEKRALQEAYQQLAEYSAAARDSAEDRKLPEVSPEPQQ